jgi:hypothetical protein
MPVLVVYVSDKADLAHIEIHLDGVTEMDWLVNVGKNTPRDAA